MVIGDLSDRDLHTFDRSRLGLNDEKAADEVKESDGDSEYERCAIPETVIQQTSERWTQDDPDSTLYEPRKIPTDNP